jgi:hypothetical protein
MPNAPSEAAPTATPVDFSAATAVRTVRFLAGRIGPREATIRAYARAARWVEHKLHGYGYRVRRQHASCGLDPIAYIERAGIVAAKRASVAGRRPG